MSQLALDLINENKKTKNTFLDLGCCGLTILPNELFECTWLTTLELNNEVWNKNENRYEKKRSGPRNKIIRLTDGILELENLHLFYAAGDEADESELDKTREISDIHLLENLRGLTGIALANNTISDINFLGNLSGLTYLTLNNNQITNIEVLSKLQNLTFLILSENKLSDITPLSKLKCIKELFLFNCQISNITPLADLTSLRTLYLGFNEIVDISSLSTLYNLTDLWLGYNQIEEVKAVANLRQLKVLHLYRNKISDIEPLGDLSSLEKLYINDNEIKSVEILSKLKNLSYVDASTNQISSLTEDFILNIDLDIDVDDVTVRSEDRKKIYLAENSIETPPLDVLKQGKDFTLNYLSNKNKRPLNECKVIIVGRGAVGKTSLQKRLFGNEPFNPSETETHGIRKRCWDNGVRDFTGAFIKVHFWDFGGQHIQQTLHQLFYTENTVYLMVLDKRKDEDPEDFLELIRVYGKDSPVIIAYNNLIELEGEQAFKYDLNPVLDSSLLNKYHNIRKVVGVCCGQENDIGISELKKYLQDFIPQIPYVRERYPNQWLQIRDDLLKTVGSNYIVFKDFVEMCQRHDVNEIELQKGLARMLTSIGTVTFFEKNFLGNYYILNPDWLTTGAYQIILSKKTIEKRGRINAQDLDEIFQDNLPFDYSREDCFFLLNLMKEFDLCHEFNKNEWLIPSSLEGQPKTDLVKFRQEENRKYCLKYEISLPESVIHRFIARNIKYSFDSDYWKNGIVVKHPETDTFIFVEADKKDREIRLWIKGSRIRDCWEYFRKDFKEFSDKFLYDELVAVDGDGKLLVAYKTLMNLASRPGIDLEKWYDPQLNIEIDVLKTLGLFEDIEKNNRYKEQIARVEKMNEAKNINIHIPINNNNAGNQNIGDNNAIDTLKEKPNSMSNDIVSATRRNKTVRRWKTRSLIVLFLSIALTTFVILASVNEYTFIASKKDWQLFKSSDLAKWGSSLVGLIWNGFVIKMVYDRFFDPSKEKALRDFLNK